jgi:pheromone shutdown protein TraB
VSLLTTPDGGKVYLVGTAHFSMESQEDVAKVMCMIRKDHLVAISFFFLICKIRLRMEDME